MSNFWNTLNNSFLKQYRSADAKLNALGDSGLTGDKLTDMQDVLSGVKQQALFGGLLSGLTGATQIGSAALDMSQLGDTSQYQNNILDLSAIGRTDYDTFGQLEQGYNQLQNNQQTVDYDTVRGGSTKERIGSTLSSAMTGASTGMAIGGPWGAAIGALVGGGTAGVGWLMGDKKAKQQKKQLETQQQIANNQALRNLYASSERASDTVFRSGVVNRAAMGGPLRQVSMKEFTQSVVDKKYERPQYGVPTYTKVKTDGGVRIKRIFNDGGTKQNFTVDTSWYAEPAGVGIVVPMRPRVEDAAMIDRQRYVESTYNDAARNSKTGALGAYQITDGALKEYVQRTGKTGDLLDPVYNRAVRDWYMNVRLPEFEMARLGSPTDSVATTRLYAAYDYGPGNTRTLLKKAEAQGIDINNGFDWLKLFPEETQNYVNYIVRGLDIPGVPKLTKEAYEAANLKRQK